MSRRRANPLSKNSSTWYILIPCILALLLTVGIYFFTLNKYDSTDKTIDYIASFYDNRGRLNDFENQLNIQDEYKDIRYFVTSDEISIYFGRVILTWENVDQLMDPNNLEHLKDIYIEIKKDPSTNKLKMYYKGVEIQRWVK